MNDTVLGCDGQFDTLLLILLIKGVTKTKQCENNWAEIQDRLKKKFRQNFPLEKLDKYYTEYPETQSCY